MANRHADLADLALGQHVVRVVAGLGWQIEGDRQAGLPLGQVLAVKRVGLRGRGMACIGPEDPSLIALSFVALGFVAHRSPYSNSVDRLLLQCNMRRNKARRRRAGRAPGPRRSAKTRAAAIV